MPRTRTIKLRGEAAKAWLAHQQWLWDDLKPKAKRRAKIKYKGWRTGSVNNVSKRAWKKRKAKRR